MNNATNNSVLPSLIQDVLNHPGQCIDNLFASLWKQLRINTLIKRCMLTKRSGISVNEVIFLLVLWKWVDSPSISVFSQRSLVSFSTAQKDVIYDLLKREDADWRNLNLATAKQVYLQRKVCNHKLKAYVLDDSIKQRRGKKMEGTACHFDHTEARHVMGQQVLTLGLVSEEVFLPLDSQIFVSDSKAIGLNHPFKDQRSTIAKRYKEATTLSKPEMAAQMLKRAGKQGIKADYLIADAWFGTKTIIKTALSQRLTPVLRMKKNKTKYPGQLHYTAYRIVHNRIILNDFKEIHAENTK